MDDKKYSMCDDLINFIKIFKWEDVRREVPHQVKFTLMLTFFVVIEAQYFLSKTHQNHFLFFSIALVLERKIKKEKIVSSEGSPSSCFSYFQERVPLFSNEV